MGHLRFTFTGTQAPYVLLEATRAQVLGSADPANVTFPLGSLTIDPAAREISGRNPERQDFLIDPHHGATVWSGYFVARFDRGFASYGVVRNGTIGEGETQGEGALLGGFVRFGEGTGEVGVRVGVSFISVEQARKNLEREIPDGTTLEETAYRTREAWAEKLDRVQIEGATTEQAEVFYTGIFHTLQVCGFHFVWGGGGWGADAGARGQYPYEQDEDGKYYSGYDNQVHEGVSYTGYSIWVGRVFDRLSFGRGAERFWRFCRTHSARSGPGRSCSRPSASRAWCRACSRTTKRAAGCPCGRTSSVSCLNSSVAVVQTTVL